MAATPDTSKPSSIKQVGEYRIEEKLGKGGMAVVFKAVHERTGHVVALKVLPPKHARNPGFTQRFVREVHSANRLSHPNVVAAYEAGQSPEGYLYFAMEYVDGESLRWRVKRHGPLLEQDAIATMLSVAYGLAHAEEAGLVHRDLKPDNIILASDGTPKIADFGLAKAPDDPTITQMGSVIGSPAFMSPEQAKGEVNPDIRSDIYSLGATFYYLLLGRPPFQGETAGVMIAQHISETAPRAHDQDPSISENTSKVIEKMLAKAPSARYQNVSELIADLDLLYRGETPRAARSGLPDLSAATEKRRATAAERQQNRPRPPIAIAMGIAAALVITIGLISFALFRKSSERDATSVAGAPANPTESGDRDAEAPGDPAAVQARPTTPPDIPKAEPPETPEQGDPRPPLGDPEPEDPETDPEPDPSETDDSHPSKRALKGLRRAADYRTHRPDDYPGQLERYQAVAAQYADEPAGDEAAKVIRAIEEAWNTEAQRELDALRRAGEAALKGGRYGEAIAAVDQFPKRLTNKRWAEAIGELKTGYRAAASKAFAGLEQQAQQALEERRLDDARALYRKAILFDVTETSAAAWKALSRIDRGEQELSLNAEKEREEYLEFWMALRRELADGDLEKGLGLTRAAAGSFKTPEIRAKVKADEADLKRLQGLAEMVEAGIKTLKPGQTLSFGGMTGVFKEYKDGRLTLTMEGAEFGQPVGRLSTQQRIEIAMRAVDQESADAEVTLALVHFYAKRPNLSKVKQHVRSADEKGADVTHLNELLDRIARLKAEEEAEKLLADVESSAKRKRWDSVRKGITTLLEDYAETRVVAANRARLNELLDQTIMWPGSLEGIVFLWMPEKERGSLARMKGLFCKLEARGEARYDDDGFMVLDDGSFIAPVVNDLLRTRCMKTSRLTIESVLEPRDRRQRGPARIISFSMDGSNRNFTLGQEGDHLILRLKVSETGPRGNGHEVRLCEMPENGAFHVIVTYSPNQLKCYLNGKKVYETEEVRGDLGGWEPHHFVLGDEYRENRDWHGVVRAVAIYSRALSEEEAKKNFEAYRTKRAPAKSY